MFRYEREFNHGHRSCLKRIHEQDVSPSSPMVLCVSSVDLPIDDKGKTRVIELTDGWYRIRAECDSVLREALGRGKLGVGVKIGITGARVRLQPFLLRHVTLDG